jgi:hypothetical protein
MASYLELQGIAPPPPPARWACGARGGNKGETNKACRQDLLHGEREQGPQTDSHRPHGTRNNLHRLGFGFFFAFLTNRKSPTAATSSRRCIHRVPLPSSPAIKQQASKQAEV